MKEKVKGRKGMDDVSIVRKLDRLGRIVLPKELRRRMDIDSRDEVEMFVDEDTIILKKYKQDACLFCGKSEYLLSFSEHRICRSCAGKIAAAKEEKDNE